MPINEFTLIQTKLKKNVHTMRRKKRLTSGSISLIKNNLEFVVVFNNNLLFEKLSCLFASCCFRLCQTSKKIS
jgi:hypothetical protein